MCVSRHSARHAALPSTQGNAVPRRILTPAKRCPLCVQRAEATSRSHVLPYQQGGAPEGFHPRILITPHNASVQHLPHAASLSRHALSHARARLDTHPQCRNARGVWCLVADRRRLVLLRRPRAQARRGRRGWWSPDGDGRTSVVTWRPSGPCQANIRLRVAGGSGVAIGSAVVSC